MILHGFFERRFHGEHPLVDRSGIVAIERDHLRTSLAASDDFERVGFDTRDRSGRDRGGRLAVKFRVPGLRCSSSSLGFRWRPDRGS